MPTLQDIAREAGVSASAVSMVINGRPGISARTRARVETAVRKLNYRPPGTGRPLKNPRPRNLAIVYAQQMAVDNPLTSLALAWIGAMRQQVTADGNRVTIFAGAGHFANDLVFQQAVTQEDLDGVLLIGMGDDYGYATALRERNTPVVVINHRPRHDAFSFVGIDNHGSGRAAARHLLELGHTRLAMIRPDATLPIILDRVEGFEATVAAAGAELVCSEVAALEHAEAALERTCRAVHAARPTAVFVIGDPLAVRCLDLWTAMGVKIPQQLSVIGFDDLGQTSASGLRPTTIGYDKARMGREAVHMLMRLIDGAGSLQSLSTVVPSQVIPYDTSASTAAEGNGRQGD